MKFWKARVEGKGFILNSSEGIRNVEFITTRWVRASDAHAAEMAVVELIREDADLQGCGTPHSMVYVTDLWEQREPDMSEDSGGGYTFYSSSKPSLRQKWEAFRIRKWGRSKSEWVDVNDKQGDS